MQTDAIRDGTRKRSLPVEVEQESPYPGSPSPTDSASSSSVSLHAELDFQLIFLSGQAITCTADSMSSVGWVKAQAAQILQVPAESIRILRNNTILEKDGSKLFDVIGPCNKLYAVAKDNVADERERAT